MRQLLKMTLTHIRKMDDILCSSSTLNLGHRGRQEKWIRLIPGVPLREVDIDG